MTSWPAVRFLLLYVAPMCIAVPWWMRARLRTLNGEGKVESWRAGVDAAMLVLAMARFVVGAVLPWSGHMLLLSYSAITTDTRDYRIVGGTVAGRDDGLQAPRLAGCAVVGDRAGAWCPCGRSREDATCQRARLAESGALFPSSKCSPPSLRPSSSESSPPCDAPSKRIRMTRVSGRFRPAFPTRRARSPFTSRATCSTTSARCSAEAATCATGRQSSRGAAFPAPSSSPDRCRERGGGAYAAHGIASVAGTAVSRADRRRGAEHGNIPRAPRRTPRVPPRPDRLPSARRHGQRAGCRRAVAGRARAEASGLRPASGSPCAEPADATSSTSCCALASRPTSSPMQARGIDERRERREIARRRRADGAGRDGFPRVPRRSRRGVPPPPLPRGHTSESATPDGREGGHQLDLRACLGGACLERLDDGGQPGKLLLVFLRQAPRRAATRRHRVPPPSRGTRTAPASCERSGAPSRRASHSPMRLFQRRARIPSCHHLLMPRGMNRTSRALLTAPSTSDGAEGREATSAEHAESVSRGSFPHAATRR